MKEELILVLVIGIILPILFTPILIDAVEVNEETLGVVVEFTYPKNLSNLKTDFDDQMNQLFANDKPSIIDSALMAKTVVTTDTPLITDSAQIELFVTDTLSITDSLSAEFFNSEQTNLIDSQFNLKHEVITNESF